MSRRNASEVCTGEGKEEPTKPKDTAYGEA